jgi:N-acetylmuramoyl-L-alanine amidase
VSAVALAGALAAWLGWHVSYAAGDAHHAAPSPRTGATAPAHSPAPTATTRSARSARPLAGKTVLLDPGHNPTNHDHIADINRLVNIGVGRKPCDTTGTATNSGYPEADFTLDVARRARALLRERGAKVVFTQDGDRAWGPCVDQRARIGNTAHADAAVSVHADGAPAGDRGFHVILPARVHKGAADTRAITGPSRRLGLALRTAFQHDTGEPRSTYIGGGTALDVRSDLGGLDLSRVPKVFIECGNMRDAADARRFRSTVWRERAARGIADGITAYLEARPAKHAK